MNIKDVFAKAENGTLTYEEFETIVKENELKFADLSEGKYVSKSKYDSDLKSLNSQMEGLNTQISDLNTTISTRDTDLENLKAQLEEASKDTTKLADVTSQFDALQTKYQSDMDAYQQRLNQQSYEFAVREFANSQKFTSQAAKRDFTQSMIAKNLQMENGKIIGGDDFVSIYSQDNADAFVVEKEPTPEPQVEPTPEPQPQPQIVTSSATGPEPQTNSGFGFNFTGVRAHN